ncbi:hypothetical protein [Micromonospora sp. DT31]|uniref:hypothetical protein n=1 Tax=Micromonospora sp. DT31 TaxID=3393434 RepID=UPI003CEA8005
MPADRDPHNAFGEPTGLWPGQDIPRQADGRTLPWPEVEVAPPSAPTRAHHGLPWPETDLPTSGQPAVGAEWAPAGGGATADRSGGAAGPHAAWAAQGPVGWNEGSATSVATAAGPSPVDTPAGPQPPPPFGGSPAGPPPPDGPRRRWRLALVAALALTLAGGGVAVATNRTEPAGPQAGSPAASLAATQPAGPDKPSAPGPSPTADQGLGGKPSAGPSASPKAGPGFAGARLTLPGASIGVQNGETFGQALTRSDRTFGRLRMARVFFPGLPPAWSGSRADVVDRTVVVSFKAAPQEINSGKHDSRLASWFASIPRDHNVYWSYFHEPEDDVERGAFTPAAYRTAWQRVAGLADRTGNPKLINTLILMCWTLDPKSGRSFDAFYPGSNVIETLGWDCYNWGAKWKRYAPPQEIYGPMISKSKALGKPWGIAETGSDLVPGDPGTGRAAWIRSMTGFLNGQRPEFVAYYNQTVSQGDFRLLDQPSIQAWKSFCTA